MANPENPRAKRATYIITGAVVLVLLAIVLAAALSPAAPENVVSGMLNSLARSDVEGLRGYVTDSVLKSTQLTALSGEESPWQLFWRDGAQLFAHYRVEEAVVQGDRAEVTVYYGPGLIQSGEFILCREGRRWKVCGASD